MKALIKITFITMLVVGLMGILCGAIGAAMFAPDAHVALDGNSWSMSDPDMGMAGGAIAAIVIVLVAGAVAAIVGLIVPIVLLLVAAVVLCGLVLAALGIFGGAALALSPFILPVVAVVLILRALERRRQRAPLAAPTA